MNKTTIFAALAVIAVLVVIAWVSSRPAATNAIISTVNNLPAAATGLTVSRTDYDFGVISMKDGLVVYDFMITNTADEPLLIEKVYTSCMCTTAVVAVAGQETGPFGMPGHGLVPAANITLESGETAAVKVTFDPAAHGPAGVGRISRAITLETAGRVLAEFQISATVKP